MGTVKQQREEFFRLACDPKADRPICGVCDRGGEIYAYCVTTTLAHLLEAMIDVGMPEWTHYKAFPDVPHSDGKTKRVTDYSKLGDFGLLEPHPERNGTWRLTPKAHCFYAGQLKVPQHVFLFDAATTGASTAECTFQDCKAGRIPKYEGVMPTPHVESEWDDCDVAEVRKHHYDEVLHGITCVCCGRWSKVYQRCIHWGMTDFLRQLMARPAGNWYHAYDDLKPFNGEYCRLEWWGLIERHAEESGLWRLTQKGIDFCHGRVLVPKFARLYNDRCLGFRGKEVSFADCAKIKPQVAAEVAAA